MIFGGFEIGIDTRFRIGINTCFWAKDKSAISRGKAKKRGEIIAK